MWKLSRLYISTVTYTSYSNVCSHRGKGAWPCSHCHEDQYTYYVRPNEHRKRNWCNYDRFNVWSGRKILPWLSSFLQDIGSFKVKWQQWKGSLRQRVFDSTCHAGAKCDRQSALKCLLVFWFMFFFVLFPGSAGSLSKAHRLGTQL